MKYPIYLCDEDNQVCGSLCGEQSPHLIRRRLLYDMVFAENKDKTRNLDFKRFYGPIFRCLQLVLPDIRAGTPHNTFVRYSEPMHEYLSRTALEGTMALDPKSIVASYMNVKTDRDLRTCALLALDKMCDSNGRALSLCVKLSNHAGEAPEMYKVSKLKDLLYKDVKRMFGVLPALRADIIQFISAKVGVLSVSETRELVYGIFALYSTLLPFTVDSQGLSVDDCRRVLIYSILKNGYNIKLEQENFGFKLKPVLNNFKNLVIVSKQQDCLEELIAEKYSIHPIDHVSQKTPVHMYPCRVCKNDFSIITIEPTASRDILYSAILLSNQDYFFIFDTTGLGDYCQDMMRRTMGDVLNKCVASKDKTPVYSAEFSGPIEVIVDNSIDLLKHNAMMDLHKLLEVVSWITSQTPGTDTVLSDLNDLFTPNC